VLFRRFQLFDHANRIQNKPTYPGDQDSCDDHNNQITEAYPASRKIRKSAVPTAVQGVGDGSGENTVEGRAVRAGSGQERHVRAGSGQERHVQAGSGQARYVQAGSGVRLQGSLTLEAALILPLVIMLMTACMSLFTMMATELRLQHIMDQVAGKLAGYTYAATALNSSEKSSLLRRAGENIILNVATEQMIKSQVKAEAPEGFSESSLIDGGVDGISFLGSRFDQSTQNITVCASYYLKVPYFSAFGARIRISQRVVRRAWTGKDSEGNRDEEIVYITESGTVYHTSLSCSHLKLSIESVPLRSVSSRRNADGGKYYPCEICAEETATVFITSYGDRYHSNRNCSGLKRTIRSVPLSQVGNRPLCKTCQRRMKK